MGLGCVGRGENGDFLMACSRNYQGIFTPQETEELSLKEAICWAIDKGYKRCIFEVDAQLVIEVIQGNMGRSQFHLIISNSVSLFKYVHDVLGCYVSRSANGVIHLLKKANRSVPDLLQDWSLNPHDFIYDVLTANSSWLMKLLYFQNIYSLKLC